MKNEKRRKERSDDLLPKIIASCHCTMKEMHLGFDSMVLNHHDLKMQRLFSEQPVD